MDSVIKVLIISEDLVSASSIQHLVKGDSAIVCSFLEDIDEDYLYTDDKLTNFFHKSETDVIILCDSFLQFSILELIKMFKQKGILIPIIVFSTRNETTLVVEVVKAGAENFLVREYLDSSKITDAIYSALQTSKKQKQLEEIRLENQKLSEAMEQNMDRAKRLHRHFFPLVLPEIDGIELEAFYEPAHNIGSDYYNFVNLKDQLIVYVVDVSGSVIDGAFINIFIRQKINRYLYVELLDNDKISPKELLNFLAKHFLKEQFPEEYFICLYVAVLDLSSRYLTYSNAGIQVPPLIVNKGELLPLSLGGLPISSAIDLELLSYEEETLYLDEASTFIISTDGIVESIIDGDIYGIERFQQLVLDYYFLPPKELKNVINADLKDILKKHITHDDITYVILQTAFNVIDEKQFIIKGDSYTIEDIIEQITSMLGTYTKEVNGLLVGFNEMVYNAIEHGHKFNNSKKIVINIEVNQVYCLITIEDEGEGFNWRSRMNKKLDIMNFEERGRGIIFTKASCDHFTYNEKGNKVYLYKKIQLFES